MDDYLSKIDEVVKRTNASYQEADEALKQNNGDVLKAVIMIENKHKSEKESNCDKNAENIINEIKNIIDKGNATKLTIKKDDEVILNIPITAGAVGVVIAPFLSLAGITAALLTQCTVEIQQIDGKVIKVNDEVEKGINVAKTNFENLKDSFN